jgi:NAD(P)-dependent dehydrogenase (short-subunit alcohol dehydrogenase family)
MVTLQEVRTHNEGLGSRAHDFVALFTGATTGIGRATVQELVSHLAGATIYVVGRSETSFAKELRQLRSLNSGVRIHFIEADVSLLREVDRVCQRVLAAETRVDLLFMTQGFIPLGGLDGALANY